MSSDTFEWEELKTFADCFVDEADFDEEITEIVDEAPIWIEEEVWGSALKRTDSISTCSTAISVDSELSDPEA